MREISVLKTTIDEIIDVLRTFFDETNTSKENYEKTLRILKEHKERYTNIIMSCVYNNKDNEYIYRRLSENNIKIVE